MYAPMSFHSGNFLNGILQSRLIERHQQVAERNTEDRHKSETIMLPGESLENLTERVQTWELKEKK